MKDIPVNKIIKKTVLNDIDDKRYCEGSFWELYRESKVYLWNKWREPVKIGNYRVCYLRSLLLNKNKEKTCLFDIITEKKYQKGILDKMDVFFAHNQDTHNRKIWSFVFKVGYNQEFVLDRYEEQHRESKRCKWVTSKKYIRSIKVESDYTAKEVITDEILAEAKMTLLRMLEKSVVPKIGYGE